MGQKDREFGSQADLIKNEAGMGTTNPDTNPEAEITRGILSRTQSKRSEFETVSHGKYLNIIIGISEFLDLEKSKFSHFLGFSKSQCFGKYLPYARHYKPQFVYFLPAF